MDHEPESIDEVIDELEEFAETHRVVTIGDVLDEFGKRSFGPAIMLPALLELTPVGAVPGVPTALALFIATVAAQLLVGRDHIWLPRYVHRKWMFGARLRKALGKIEGVAEFLGRLSGGRLEQFAEGLPVRIAALAVILLCCIVPPLELLPFASSVPMATIAMIGLALTVRDGLLMLVAGTLTLLAFGTGIYLVATHGITLSFL